MPTLTIIAGPNGSGKSTPTAAQQFEGRANLVDPDAIARRINPFDPARAAGAAGRKALTRWSDYLAHQVSFAVENHARGQRNLRTDARREMPANTTFTFSTSR